MKYAVLIKANAVLINKGSNIALHKMRFVVQEEEAVRMKAIAAEILAVKRNNSA